MSLRMKPFNIENDDVDVEAGDTDTLLPENTVKKSPPTPVVLAKNNSGAATLLEFIFAFCGLIISYVVWGVMQELIMNTKFSPTPSVASGMFPSTTFCVFSNRALAIIVATVCCYWRHGTVVSAASFLSFTPAALSNTISSWAQYESLAYVSFPLQNLFKSTKLIPVMIMGRLLNNTSYSIVEILEAVCISIGVLIFSTTKATQNSNHSGGVSAIDSSLLGFFLLGLYIVSDSFTSQYQTSIYKKYGKIDQFHMMFGVNLSAIVMTVCALIVSGEIPIVMEFLFYNPIALLYNIITAICSATGQMFIYYTIRKFGPVVFTVIMTTRQIISMVVSTVYFGHPLPPSAIFGTIVVFVSVFHSIYRQFLKSQTKSSSSSSSSSKGGQGG